MAAAIKAEIDRTLAAVEEGDATLQVNDHKIKTNNMVSKCQSAPWPLWRRPMQLSRLVTIRYSMVSAFRITKAVAIKAEIDRILAALEEANATLKVGDHKIKTNSMVSKCHSG